MNKLILIGSGNMSIAYCKVLQSLNVDFTVVGNSESKCQDFKSKTGVHCISGGIENYLNNIDVKPSHAIVAVQVEALYKISALLVKQGILNILVEKPGGIDENETPEETCIRELAEETGIVGNYKILDKSLSEKE